MDKVLTALVQSYKAYQTKLYNRPLYIACSGGRDSMALVYAWLLVEKLGVGLPSLTGIIHVNHQLQVYADEWQRQVQAFADRFDLLCLSVQVKVEKNSEQAARQARYRAFFEALRSDSVLMLGHHQNDQAETVLMRLMNGASVDGLSAMPVWQTYDSQTFFAPTTLSAPRTIHLFRPWLGIDRADITAFANKQGLTYIDDPTNQSTDNPRNLIRNAIIPIFERINPKAVSAIARSAALLADAKEIVHLNIDALKKDSIFAIGNASLPIFVLDISKLSTTKALNQALIHHFMTGDECYSANAKSTQAVLTLCQRAQNDHQSELIWGQWVFCRYDTYVYRYPLRFWQALKGTSAGAISQTTITLSVEDHRFVATITDLDASLTLTSNPAYTLKKLDRQTKLKVGQYFLSGKKLYQALGVPVWLREHLYLLLKDGTPVMLVSFFMRFWAGGQVLSDVVKFQNLG